MEIQNCTRQGAWCSKCVEYSYRTINRAAALKAINTVLILEAAAVTDIFRKINMTVYLFTYVYYISRSEVVITSKIMLQMNAPYYAI